MSDYQNIFNTSIDVIFIHHPKTGEVLFVNERFKDVYGYSAAKIIEEGLPLIFPLDNSFHSERDLNNIRLAAKGEEPHFEMTNRHADGHEFWVEVRLKSILIDNENRVMAIVRDITDKKIAVANLEQSVQFQKTLNFFTSSLINKNTEEAILEDVVEKSVEVFGFEDIVIYLKNESDTLTPMATSGRNVEGKPLLVSDVKELHVGEGLVGLAAEKLQSIIVNDLTNDLRYFADTERRSSEISVPIIYQGDVLGVIDSEHSEKNFYTDLHLEILEAIASLTAIKLMQTRSENQVRHNEKKLKSILDSSPDIIYVIDANGIYREVYTDDLTKLEASREQLIGKNICDFFPKDIELIKKAIKRVVQTRKTETVEFTRLKSNGEKAWFSANIAFFEYQNGSAVLLFSRDITHKRLAHLEIERSQQVLNSINQNISEGVYRSYAAGGLIYVNKAFVKMFGYSSGEEVLKLKSTDLYAESRSRSGLTDAIKKDKQRSNKEVLFKRKDGSTFWGLNSFILTKDQNGDAVFDGAIRDVSVIKKNAEKLNELNETLREQNNKLALKEQELESYNEELIANRDNLVNILEELSDRNFELDQLVYRTSHDLRAPLRSVLGLANLYHMEVTSPPNTYVSKIEERIHKMDDFIKSMLDYSRTSRLELKPIEVNLDGLISDCLSDLEFLEGFDKVKIIINKNRSNYKVVTDEVRLKVILSNILSNAIKYRNPREANSYLKINIKIAKRKTSIAIEDNGIGINEKYLHNVFDMFYRATEKSEGSGLGMYIVKQSVDKLGGTITVESKEGEGTTFNVILPNNV